jgi:hypothetical protein
MRPRVLSAASALSRPIPASTASAGIKNRKWRNPVKAGPRQITWQASGKITISDTSVISLRCRQSDVPPDNWADIIVNTAPNSMMSGTRIAM